MAETLRDQTVVLKRIATPKPQVLLADQLREAILSGEFVQGQVLPPERELVLATGLTRGAVREALRTLAVEGFLEARSGRFGGNVVTLPSREFMASAIGRFVRGRRLPLKSLHETRDILEPALAHLAALHRTAEDIQALRQLHESLVAAQGNFPEFATLNIRWHRAIASASHNELLAGVLESIAYGVSVSTSTEEYDTPETRKQVIRIHARIMEAIEAGDGPQAELRMRQHIGATHARASAPGTTIVPLSAEGEPG
ncbi:FadR/GntR family transcriptional regulator [Ottowia thiooxydans]|uniref:FadR/GntR family transcriptional regulator n=1 Tax=Ottowia thiooxydans TaxID=219182 RepID=UPI000426E0EC|nr:FCD domain-containing protein [Ottowia thiooxydans]